MAGLRVSELVDGFLAHLKAERGLSPNTIEAYGRDLSKCATSPFGIARLDAFRAQRGGTRDRPDDVGLLAKDRSSFTAAPYLRAGTVDDRAARRVHRARPARPRHAQLVLRRRAARQRADSTHFR